MGIEDDDDIDPDKLSLIQDLEEVVGAETVKRHSSANRESVIRLLKRFPSKTVSSYEFYTRIHTKYFSFEVNLLGKYGNKKEAGNSRTCS